MGCAVPGKSLPSSLSSGEGNWKEKVERDGSRAEIIRMCQVEINEKQTDSRARRRRIGRHGVFNVAASLLVRIEIYVRDHQMEIQ